MTQRKFKHKETGWYAKTMKTSNSLMQLTDDPESSGYFCFIPSEFVSEKYGWQEITPELVEGRWYVTNLGAIGRLDEKSKTGTYSYLRDAVNEDKTICYSISLHANNIEREATPSEIHKALDTIRIEKGLVEGVKVVSAIDNMEKRITGDSIKYYEHSDTAYVEAKSKDTKYCAIYDRGNWATKVSEPVLVTEDGYKVYDGDQMVYAVDTRNMEIDEFYADVCASKSCDEEEYLYFYKGGNAEQYIEDHSPCFSKADLGFLKSDIIGDLHEPLSNAKVINIVNAHTEDLIQSKT